MGACKCKPCKDQSSRKKKSTLHQLDLDDLSEVIQSRSYELSKQVVENLNNKALPDFLEQPAIESMIFTIFSTLLVIMVGSGSDSK